MTRGVFNMTATHKSIADSAEGGKPDEVTAWQFNSENPIPVWVARKFHKVGGPGTWTGISVEDRLVEAHPGDWAVAIAMAGGHLIIVLSDEEFNQGFEPV